MEPAFAFYMNHIGIVIPSGARNLLFQITRSPDHGDHPISYGFFVISPIFATVSPFFIEGTPQM